MIVAIIGIVSMAFLLALMLYGAARLNPENKNTDNMEQEKKDLCKTCEHYWQDFPLPLDHVESHCEVLDGKTGLGTMDETVPYPCVECPFECYRQKQQNQD